MKTNTRQRSKKPLIISLVVIGLLIIGAGSYIYASSLNNSSDSTPPIDKPATQEEIDNGNKIKEEAADRDKANSSSEDAVGDTLDVVLNEPNQTGSLYQVRVMVLNYISDTGECTLTLTRNGKTVTKTSGLQSLPSTSTCDGFDIPVSELSAGTWQAAVSVTSDTKKGSASAALEVR